LPAGQTAGIAYYITQRSILVFFVQWGRHIAPLVVKSGVNPRQVSRRRCKGGDRSRYEIPKSVEVERYSLKDWKIADHILRGYRTRTSKYQKENLLRLTT